MGKLRKFFSVVGALAVLASIALLLLPGMISGLPEIPSILRTAGIWALMGLLGIYALKAFRIKPLDASKLYLTSEQLPETVEDPEEDLRFELIAGPGEIRETVREVLEMQHGYSRDEAQQMIENGGWTSSGIPSAFIEDSLNYPVLERLREWLEDSGTEERRLRKTVDAVEKLHREGER